MKENTKDYEYPMLINGRNIITECREKAEIIMKALVSTDNLNQEERTSREETIRNDQYEGEIEDEENRTITIDLSRSELSSALKKLGKSAPRKDGICYTM